MRNKFFFVTVFSGTFLMAVLLQLTGKPLVTKSTPLGILNLELAATTHATQQIVNVWERNNLIPVAEIHTARDFVYLLFYSLLLFTSCQWLSKKIYHSAFLHKAGKWLSVAALFAGAMDVLENCGMFVSLTGRVSEKITLLTFYASVTKWAIVTLCLVYLLSGLLYYLLQKKVRLK